jgi:hypothetical protein
VLGDWHVYVVGRGNLHFAVIDKILTDFAGDKLIRYYGDDMEITIDEQLEEICPTCFMETYSLEKVVFTQPLRVIIIGFSAFDACSALVRIDIPRTVTRIGEMAFFFCDDGKLRGPSGS